MNKSFIFTVFLVSVLACVKQPTTTGSEPLPEALEEEADVSLDPVWNETEAAQEAEEELQEVIEPVVEQPVLPPPGVEQPILPPPPPVVKEEPTPQIRPEPTYPLPKPQVIVKQKHSFSFVQCMKGAGIGFKLGIPLAALALWKFNWRSHVNKGLKLVNGPQMDDRWQDKGKIVLGSSLALAALSCGLGGTFH